MAAVVDDINGQAGLPTVVSWWNARSSTFVMILMSSELSSESYTCPMLAFSKVGRQGNGSTTHLSAEQDGAFHEHPRSKVCTFLLDRQVAVADFHHIHIVVRKEVNRR
jgi:hypothetical protein